jgi:hypothetical protein
MRGGGGEREQRDVVTFLWSCDLVEDNERGARRPPPEKELGPILCERGGSTGRVHARYRTAVL